ncbi:hypothetical protein TrCOL_g3533 [Triparma columacea]|uniref:Uncharacterized protein n=1 Tax=Triparma columacea TaxID=722753 RepID=A0A9W7FXW2_9STRA|nr:hypothetical protein TrCOL_g3533 [Triparma columacea]
MDERWLKGVEEKYKRRKKGFYFPEGPLCDDAVVWSDSTCLQTDVWGLLWAVIRSSRMDQNPNHKRVAKWYKRELEKKVQGVEEFTKGVTQAGNGGRGTLEVVDKVKRGETRVEAARSKAPREVRNAAGTFVFDQATRTWRQTPASTAALASDKSPGVHFDMHTEEEPILGGASIEGGGEEEAVFGLPSSSSSSSMSPSQSSPLSSSSPSSTSEATDEVEVKGSRLQLHSSSSSSSSSTQSTIDPAVFDLLSGMSARPSATPSLSSGSDSSTQMTPRVRPLTASSSSASSSSDGTGDPDDATYDYHDDDNAASDDGSVTSEMTMETMGTFGTVATKEIDRARVMSRMRALGGEKVERQNWMENEGRRVRNGGRKGKTAWGGGVREYVVLEENM